MIRLLNLRLWATLLLGVWGCEADQGTSSGQASSRISTRPAATTARNPFEFYRYGQKDLGIPTPVADCAELRLTASDFARGSPLKAVLRVNNRCSESVAVLTSPLEVRFRLRKEDRFPAELMDAAAYSVVYVFDTQVGLPKEAFHGDGALTVTALPAYYWVIPHTPVDIPITGSHPKLSVLPPSSYGISILTPVVFASGFPERRVPFDLGLSVEKHNGTQEGATKEALRLPPSAARLSAVAFFEVK